MARGRAAAGQRLSRPFQSNVCAALDVGYRLGVRLLALLDEHYGTQLVNRAYGHSRLHPFHLSSWLLWRQ